MNDRWLITLDKASILTNRIDTVFILYSVVNGCCIDIKYKSDSLNKVKSVYNSIMNNNPNPPRLHITKITLTYQNTGSEIDFITNLKS